MVAFCWKLGRTLRSTVHLHSSIVSPYPRGDELSDLAVALKATLTSSVYRMILSLSAEYRVATNIRSKYQRPVSKKSRHHMKNGDLGCSVRICYGSLCQYELIVYNRNGGAPEFLLYSLTSFVSHHIELLQTSCASTYPFLRIAPLATRYWSLSQSHPQLPTRRHSVKCTCSRIF